MKKAAFVVSQYIIYSVVVPICLCYDQRNSDLLLHFIYHNFTQRNLMTMNNTLSWTILIIMEHWHNPTVYTKLKFLCGFLWVLWKQHITLTLTSWWSLQIACWLTSVLYPTFNLLWCNFAANHIFIYLMLFTFNLSLHQAYVQFGSFTFVQLLWLGLKVLESCYLMLCT